MDMKNKTKIIVTAIALLALPLISYTTNIGVIKILAAWSFGMLVGFITKKAYDK